MDRPDDRWEAWLAMLTRGIAIGDRERDAAWQEVSQRARHIAGVLLRQYDVWTIDAEDVVQDVLVRLYSSSALRRMQASGSADGYLFVVIRNRILDESRRNRVRWGSDDDALDSATPAPDELSLDQQIALDEVLRELTPDEYTLIRLRFWEDRSINDIAAELGVTYSAASVRLFRLLRKLRERLQQSHPM
ncbi:MAG TPA: sigma-70 family RNA polymerase sigma factor [Longimicrobium sp.]|jgi:RNA polymerase sigma-70 factor (ECF subfamily)